MLPYYERRTRASPTSSAPYTQDARDGAAIQQPVFPHNYTPRRPRTARIGRSLRNTNAHRTADEILGLARENVPERGSLDAEIESYLGEPISTLTSLVYWEVSIGF